MNNLISRQDALKIKVSDGYDRDGVLYVPLRDVLKHLKQLPSAEQERKTGKWIHDGIEIECGRCGAIYPDYKHPICGRHKYCPNCGAKMEGEER